MNKKLIRLTEGDLHKIVKESASKILSEAYGTMPNQDKATMWNLNNSAYSQGGYDTNLRKRLSSDDVRNRAYDFDDKGRKLPFNPDKRMPDEIRILLHLSDEITDVLGSQNYFKFIDENIGKALNNKLRETEKLIKFLVNKAKMNLGQQPDEKYFERHDTKANKDKRERAKRDAYFNDREQQLGSYYGF